MSCIAEGCGRRTDKDAVQFLYVALGSVKEVESRLLLAKEFKYLDESRLAELEKELDKISRMLMGFVNYVSRHGEK